MHRLDNPGHTIETGIAGDDYIFKTDAKQSLSRRLVLHENRIECAECFAPCTAIRTEENRIFSKNRRNNIAPHPGTAGVRFFPLPRRGRMFRPRRGEALFTGLTKEKL